MSITWVTIQEAKDAVDKGKIPALENSLKHHCQGRDADWMPLKDAIESGVFEISGADCACCRKWGKRGTGKPEECPLYTDGCGWDECCGGTVADVKNYYYMLSRDYSNANFKAFQEAEAKVCDYIEAVLEKERAKEKKAECEGCKHSCPSCSNRPCRDCSNRSLWVAKEKESKPKLRHGDYGYDHTGRPCMSLKIQGEDTSTTKPQRRASNLYAYPYDLHTDIFEVRTVLGNIFDDLKRNSQDLREFEVDHLNVILSKQFGTDVVLFKSICSNRTFTIDEAIKFHQKLGQMLATAQREQNDGK